MPSLNFGIEYDGFYYHNDKISDYEKTKSLLNAGVCLLKVKEVEKSIIGCYCTNNIIVSSRSPSEVQLNEIIIECFKYINWKFNSQFYFIDVDVKRDRAKIYELYIKTEKKKSFFAKYPELSMQWHPTKNLNVKPDMVRLSSNKKIWWQCEKGHEWEASIANRRTTGCPFCSGQRVCADNCLQTLRPELAKQWHPTKNGNLTPSDVTIGTSKKVWWRCEKGHEWEAPVHNRTKGYGCSICSGHQVSSDNSLLTLNPELAKQWHPSKNGDLTSSDVTVSSNRKIWWICEKGHEWETSIAKRTIGRSCPYCSNQRVHKDNCMQTLSPELAKQWHSTKNGNLTPRDVTIGSGKKVWWQCKKGHEWQAAICDRSRGRGCPFCSGKRKC